MFWQKFQLKFVIEKPLPDLLTVSTTFRDVSVLCNRFLKERKKQIWVSGNAGVNPSVPGNLLCVGLPPNWRILAFAKGSRRFQNHRIPNQLIVSRRRTSVNRGFSMINWSWNIFQSKPTFRIKKKYPKHEHRKFQDYLIFFNNVITASIYEVKILDDVSKHFSTFYDLSVSRNLF